MLNFQEIEVTEHNLKTQLENALKEQEAAQHKASTAASGTTENALLEAKSAINLKSKDLEEKKRELACYLWTLLMLCVLNATSESFFYNYSPLTGTIG